MHTELESLHVLYPRRAPEPLSPLALEEFRDAMKVILQDSKPAPEPQADNAEVASDTQGLVSEAFDEGE